MTEIKTIKLTTAQAIVRFLANQYIVIDGREERLCGGGFGIFGHGNVTCLGEALYQYRSELPLYRGQNEQSMGFAAAAYSKYHKRQKFMFCTASAGPGTTNLVTSSALAHTNRLPMLMLCGDGFMTRLPDPILQQVEDFGNPTASVIDAFRSVTRFWDRVTHPAQVIQSMPAAIATMLDPADCGPAFIGLPQDVQGWAYDYPESFFAKKVHYIRRTNADEQELEQAIKLIGHAKKPIIIAGGGVQYSKAEKELYRFAEQCEIPVVETIAGRANMLYSDRLNCGPIGVTGSNSANSLAADADVVIAIGTRLQDFTTGSWTAFRQDAQFVCLNVGRHDASKHRAISVVGDAKQSLHFLTSNLTSYVCPQQWQEKAQEEREKWDSYTTINMRDGNRPNSYAQVIGAVNDLCSDGDRVVSAAGGLPAEITANWRTKKQGTVDVEFGFSCMGYEIAGGWGARIAQVEREPKQDTIVFLGDGSYLIMNSDIYSSVLTAKKMIILVCDNGGYAVINKLQNNTGNASFNNLISDCNINTEPFSVDFVAHAKSQGALAESVETIDEFRAAFMRAKEAEITTVISIKVDPYEGWTAEGHAWWEVGLPSVTERSQVRDAVDEWEEGRKGQRKGV